MPSPSLSSSSPQSVIDRVAFRRVYIRQHGTSVIGTSQRHNPNVVPAWFEPETFANAQQIYKTYSSVLGLSQLYGLLLGISFYPGLAPLIATGQSGTLSTLFTRYLSTNVHIRQWFAGGSPFDRTSTSYRSLKVVRSLHLQVSSKLNQISGGMSLVSCEYNSNDLWMNQWSMMHVQFAFIGLSTVFPDVLGFGKLSSYERHCLLHFWRVIGYCLGIEDRFNLCTGNTDEEVIEMCRQVYYCEWKPQIEFAAEKAGKAMAEDIAFIMFRIVPIITYRALMSYVAPTFGLENISDFQLKTKSDYFYYGLLSFIMKSNARFRFLTKLSSIGFTIFEKLAFWGKNIHQKTLSWWYPKKTGFSKQ